MLGNIYKDAITGFMGACTAHCRHICGEDRLLLEPSVQKIGDEKGKAFEPQWFDRPRLILIGEGAANLPEQKGGGIQRSGTG